MPTLPCPQPADLPVPMLAPATSLAQDPQLAAAMQRSAAATIASGQYVLGPQVAAFEQAAAALLHAQHGVGVANGSDALLLALAAMGLGPGDQVVVPSYTFVATAGSVARLGAQPRFADVCPACLTLLPGHAKALINAHTRALVPVHLFGQVAAMTQLVAVARQYDLGMVEDAAQSFAAAPSAKLPAALPHLYATSFFPSKNLGACGDAGLVAGDNDALIAKLRALRVHGSSERYLHTSISGNFRIDALQAGLLQTKLPTVATALARRQANAQAYGRLFAAANVVAAPAAQPPCCCAVANHAAAIQAWQHWQQSTSPAQITLPQVAAHHSQGHHTFNQYVVRFANAAVRDHVAQSLGERGIGWAIYYPIPLHLQPCFAHLGGKTGDLPISEAAAATSLALPIADHLTAAQVDAVAGAVVRALRTAPGSSAVCRKPSRTGKALQQATQRAGGGASQRDVVQPNV